MDRKWVTFAVLLVLLAGGSALVAVLGGGGGGGRAIQLQQAPTEHGGLELLVTVSDELNVPETAEGRETVDLVCRDGAGAVVIRARHEWPLLKDGEPPAPHIHQPASRDELRSIAGCRIIGTSPELRGKLGLAR